MDHERQNIASGGPWEAVVGYSRAVRIHRHVWISGSTASTDGGPVGGDDPAEQAREALRRIEAAIVEAGGSLADVVRTRMYLTDMSCWEAVGRVHGEIFGSIRPATTMVAVSALIAPDLLVEIEAEAFLGDPAAGS